MKQCMKKIAVSILVMAMMITMIPTNTQAATVKLNKKSATISVGDKVTLKLNNAKSVNWSTSDKKIATVTSKGVVKGVKAGKCNVIAKNKKTGKSYTCKVTVKALKSFGIKADKIFFNEWGDALLFDGDILNELLGATLSIDGKKIPVTEKNSGKDGVTYISFEKIANGEHKVVITKKGYKTLTLSLICEAQESEEDTDNNGLVDYVQIFKGEEGNAFVDCMIKQEVVGKPVKIVINGETVFSETATTDDREIVDGCWDYLYPISDKGTYSVTISIDGYDDYSTTLTY